MIASCDILVRGVVNAKTSTSDKYQSIEAEATEEFMWKMNKIDKDRMKNARMITVEKWRCGPTATYVTWAPLEMPAPPRGEMQGLSDNVHFGAMPADRSNQTALLE